MPRPPPVPSTALAAALQLRRNGRRQAVAAEEAGLPEATLSRIERGTHAPSYPTAVRLATWLGWTVERVMDAAAEPVPPPPPPES